MKSPETRKQLFIIEDDPTLRLMLQRVASTRWGFDCREFSAGEDALTELDESVDAVLLDLVLPGTSGMAILTAIKDQFRDLPVIVLSAQERIETAIQTLRQGATDYFTKPPDLVRLEASLNNAVQAHNLTREVSRLRGMLAAKARFDNIISIDPTMQDVFNLVQKVKDIDIDVLIQGESGTGKELIARAIHFGGKRSSGPFVVVNCASIPRDLLESELFGHERGAFTGAIQRRIGKFEQANGGTIFLDEIAELDLTLQGKLLRVIQSKEFDRVGGHELIRADVRIVSATNKNLQEHVARKLFREDLYFRLSTFPIHLPPLRKRTSDIPLLVEHFIRAAEERMPGRSFNIAAEALEILKRYAWPGNVRELEHAIERACILTEGDKITENELPMNIRMARPLADHSSGGEYDEPVRPLEAVKELAVRNAVRHANGNLVEAARLLGIGRATLYRLLKKYRISD